MLHKITWLSFVTGRSTFVYVYPDGNDEARNEVERCAFEQSEKANANALLIPSKDAKEYWIMCIPPTPIGEQVMRDILNQYSSRTE